MRHLTKANKLTLLVGLTFLVLTIFYFGQLESTKFLELTSKCFLAGLYFRRCNAYVLLEAVITDTLKTVVILK